MEIFTIAAELLLMCGTLFGFCYGIRYYFQPRKAVFPQIVVCGLGCLSLGQIFTVLRLILGESISIFHVGMLAPIGFTFFILTANYGQMDSLLDNGAKENKKYAVTALAAPAVVLLAIVLLWASGASQTIKIIDSISFAVCAAAAYFNLKHAIYPDVEGGIIDTIRWYNRIALMIEGAGIAAFLCAVWKLTAARDLLLIAEGVLCAVLMPVFKREAKRWYR